MANNNTNSVIVVGNIRTPTTVAYHHPNTTNLYTNIMSPDSISSSMSCSSSSPQRGGPPQPPPPVRQLPEPLGGGCAPSGLLPSIPANRGEVVVGNNMYVGMESLVPLDCSSKSGPAAVDGQEAGSKARAPGWAPPIKYRII